MCKPYFSRLFIFLLVVFAYFIGGLIICLLLISIALFIRGFLIWKGDNYKRRPGTVTHSNFYVSSKKIIKPKYIIKPKQIRSRQIVKSVYRSETTTTVMDTPKRLSSGSPASRSPLRVRNDGDTIERRTDSSSANMTVGEFPLISLVSSLHEAVTPKPHRLKPSPLTIRIQPPSPLEVCSEAVADPVVSVLKQISSNKRVFVSTGNDDEQKDKRKRGIPRHDLTHSLLESQLTTNVTSPLSRDGSSSKRERDDGNSPVSAGATGRGSGNIMSASAPKRLCARSLRSNEILSSLSSSISLISPPPPPSKSYMGKRKTVSSDKYKKVRKVDHSNTQVPSPIKVPSPAKVDKCVTTCEAEEKSTYSLPVISIKRDEISERVVSRAMVSALLKSTVSKLMMSGDPMVYPVPNGTQLRQPEVTPPQFGPLEKASTASSISFPSDRTPAPAISQMFSLASQTGGTALTSQTVTTSTLSLTSSPQTLFSLDKPQVSLGSDVPSFGLDPKLDVKSTSAIASPPKFGLPITTSAVSSVPPSFGIPSVPSQVSPAIPSFGIPSTSTGVLSTPSFSIPSTSCGVSVASNIGIPFTSSSVSSAPSFVVSSTASGITMTTPSFGVSSTTSPSSASQPILTFGGSSQEKVLTTTSSPSFGLRTTVSSSMAPTFSFGGSTSNEVKVSTAPPSFASVVAGSNATPTFGLGNTLITPNLFAPVPKSNAPVKFGESPPTGTSAASIFGGALSTPVLGFKGIPTTSTSVTTASSTVPISSASVFGSMASTTAPLFNPSSSNVSEIKSANPVVTTSSPSIFGSSALLFSAASATPTFGAGSGTTSSVVFGANPSVTSSSIFGASSTPVFGSAVTTTATPLFSSSTTTTASTTSAPLFGSFTGTSTTSTAPIFGATASTASNLFGGVSTSSVTPLFSGTVTTAAPIFGANTSTPVFGSTTATTTSTPIFGSSTPSLTPSSAPLFGSVTTATTLFGSGGTTGTFTGSSFGSSTSSSTKTGETLFGMPSSSSGFKTASPFQLAGGNEGVSSSGFGSGANTKPFEFGGSKPSSGGFTFKPSGTATAFTSQAQPVTVTTSSLSFPQTLTPQASFSFSGGGNTGSTGSTTGPPFVFGTPQSQVTATGGSAIPAAGGATPFPFGTPTAGTPAPTFGQSFSPAFPQSSPAPNMSFASPAPAVAQPSFQFNAGGQPTPATPGNAGGLFSIGTGSSGSRNRDRRDRRRRV